jgi:hypothetical protein
MFGYRPHGEGTPEAEEQDGERPIFCVNEPLGRGPSSDFADSNVRFGIQLARSRQSGIGQLRPLDPSPLEPPRSTYHGLAADGPNGKDWPIPDRRLRVIFARKQTFRSEGGTICTCPWSSAMTATMIDSHRF